MPETQRCGNLILGTLCIGTCQTRKTLPLEGNNETAFDCLKKPDTWTIIFHSGSCSLEVFTMRYGNHIDIQRLPHLELIKIQTGAA